MFDKDKVKLGIAPIGWCNDDMPELGAENTFRQTVSEMALAGFTGCEIGNTYPKDPKELKWELDLRGMRIASRWFSSFRNIVSLVSVVLIVILFVVSVFIMQNTIKLATFSRREEIGIMKMVGASNSFIRCPFIVEGLILGLLGGALAFFALWGIYDVACEKIMEGMIGSILVVPVFRTIMYPILIIYLLIGFVVGTFGSNIAIRNYLKV